MTTIYSLKTAECPQPITEKIKTFADACNFLKIQEIKFELTGMDGDMISVIAYTKLIIIIRALNEGWVPDWENSSQYKYYPWFKHKSGFGLSFNVYVDWFTVSCCSSRLCFKSSELATYAATQFADIYNDYLTIKP